MFNQRDILNFLNNPESVDKADPAQLRRLRDIFPYCEKVHWMLLRNLYVNDDVTFEHELLSSGMHISSRRQLYNYLTFTAPTPQNIEADSTDQLFIAPSTPDYFSMVENTDRQTLQQLAANLRANRLKRLEQKRQDEIIESGKKTPQPPSEAKEETQKPSVPPKKIDIASLSQDQITQELVQKLISEKKYSTALEILSKINLNNPKKSVYFALQIKYLQTIVDSNKPIR